MVNISSSWLVIGQSVTRIIPGKRLKKPADYYVPVPRTERTCGGCGRLFMARKNVWFCMDQKCRLDERRKRRAERAASRL